VLSGVCWAFKLDSMSLRAEASIEGLSVATRHGRAAQPAAETKLQGHPAGCWGCRAEVACALPVRASLVAPVWVCAFFACGRAD
jgi:hypothetical protein